MQECLNIDLGLLQQTNSGRKPVTERGRGMGADLRDMLCTLCHGCYNFDRHEPIPIYKNGELVAIQERYLPQEPIGAKKPREI